MPMGHRFLVLQLFVAHAGGFLVLQTVPFPSFATDKTSRILTISEARDLSSTVRHSKVTPLYVNEDDDNRDDLVPTLTTTSPPPEETRNISATTIYFDIGIADTTPIGRLIFHLTYPSPLPLHAENIIQLAKGSRRSIDPRAHYVGCEFDYSPASVEDGMGRYRWGHQLRGRGRNAVGPADGIIVDPENQSRHVHSCFGGQYYGDKYDDNETTNGDDDEEGVALDDPGVLLTVPVEGPGRGSSKFSIVRVGESPREWGERLLINAGVIGRMDPESLGVLHAMARQRKGPPKVIAAGVL